MADDVTAEQVLYSYASRRSLVFPLIIAAAPGMVALFAFRLLVANFETGNGASLSSLIILVVVALFSWIAFATFRGLQGKDHSITITDRHLEQKVGAKVQSWQLGTLSRIGLFTYKTKIRAAREIDGTSSGRSSYIDHLKLVLQSSDGTIDEIAVPKAQRHQYLDAMRQGTGLEFEELSAAGGTEPAWKPNLSHWANG